MRATTTPRASRPRIQCSAGRGTPTIGRYGGLSLLLLFLGALPAGPSDTSPEIRFRQNVEWSSDGRRIAYSEYVGDTFSPENWSVWIADSDGRNRHLVVADGVWPSWSPDGRRLAFASRRNGSSDLFLVDLESGDVERLTSDPGGETAPAWSPSGGAVAYVSDRDGDDDIYVLDLESGESREIVAGPENDSNPQWSADGGSLVFYREVGDGMDQILTQVLGEQPVAVTGDRNLNVFPSFLSAGRVAFSSRPPGGAPSLVIVDPARKTRHPVGPEGAFFARWSPDESRILYIAGRWPSSTIYSMAADGSDIRPIVD